MCANSWGTQWGENGLFRIVRGDDECKIESFVLGVWGKVDGRQIVSRGGARGRSRGREFNTLYPQGDQPIHRHQKRHRKNHVKKDKAKKRDEQTKERGSGKDAGDINKDDIIIDDILRETVKEEIDLLEIINKAYDKERRENKEETVSNEEHHEKKKKHHKRRNDDNAKYYKDLSDIIDKHFNLDK